MSEDRILAKIRKLLARGADDRGNENEREMAMRQAHAMLIQHNLSMADVGSSAPQEEREQRNSKLSVFPWARGIAHSIAQGFFCTYFFSRGAGKLATHSFVGKQSNAITAQELAEYVIASVFKELRARYGSETAPEARSFAVGVESAVRARCAAMRREAELAEKPASDGRALVLASLYASEKLANDAWVAQHVGKLVTQKDRTKGVQGLAYAAGKVHGNSISLNRQVGGSASSAKRIGN